MNYYYYKKVKAAYPDSPMGGYTRLLHRCSPLFGPQLQQQAQAGRPWAPRTQQQASTLACVRGARGACRDPLALACVRGARGACRDPLPLAPPPQRAA